MDEHATSPNLTQALVRAGQHWQSRRQAELENKGLPGEVPSAFTIAFSREFGALGTTVARAVGERLGWPVYDHEILEQIAKEMNLRVRLLESVDERRMSWIEECLESFALRPTQTESADVRDRIQILFSLATHGECVIVGRGSALILPVATTLRVRLVAPLDVRVQVICRDLNMQREEALRHIQTRTRERLQFVKDHFQKDAEEPENFDLVLNTGRYAVAECADLIVAALRTLEKRAADKKLRLGS